MLKFRKALKKLKKLTAKDDSRPFLNYICFSLEKDMWWGMASDGLSLAKIPVDMKNVSIINNDNVEVFVIHRDCVDEFIRFKHVDIELEPNWLLILMNTGSSHLQHYAKKLSRVINNYLKQINLPNNANFNPQLLKRVGILDGNYAKIHHGVIDENIGMLAIDEDGGQFVAMGLKKNEA